MKHFFSLLVLASLLGIQIASPSLAQNQTGAILLLPEHPETTTPASGSYLLSLDVNYETGIAVAMVREETADYRGLSILVWENLPLNNADGEIVAVNPTASRHADMSEFSGLPFANGSISPGGDYVIGHTADTIQLLQLPGLAVVQIVPVISDI